jgi:hypothetical protein
MYYADEAENSQLAIDCFEIVLKKSNKKEKLLEASNCKSQAWFWRLTIDPKRKGFREHEFPFRTWAKIVATTYRYDPTAVCYYALSSRWLIEYEGGELAWFHLAWTLLRTKNQPPPPGFYYIFFLFSFSPILLKLNEGKGEFGDLPILLSALERLEIFLTTMNLKDIYVVDRFVAIICIQAFMTDDIVTQFTS